MTSMEDYLVELITEHAYLFKTFDEIDHDEWYFHDVGDAGYLCYPGWLIELDTLLYLKE